MAEALLRHMGGNRFVALSAGNKPAGYVHPYVIETMERMKVPVKKQYSKSYEQFLGEELDVVITVCDNVACMSQPKWSGDPAIAHWSLPDPVFHPGTVDECLHVAAQVADQLKKWIGRLIALDLDTLSHPEIEAELKKIAETREI